VPFLKLTGAGQPVSPEEPPDRIRLSFFTVDQVNEARLQLLPPLPRMATAPVWQLDEAFGFRDKTGQLLVVPAHSGNIAKPGNSTDLATVPAVLWGVLAPYGRQMRPALLHDYLCDQAALTAVPKTKAALADAYRQREAADYLFRDALGDDGVRVARRWIFWAGVSFGRFRNYRRWFARALAVLVAVGALVQLHAAAVAAGGGPDWSTNWLHRWQFGVTLGGLALLLALLKWWAFAGVAIGGGIALALCVADSGSGDGGWHGLRSLTWHGIAFGAVVLLVLLLGPRTDWRVGIIGLLIAPIILAVILVTTAAELLLALPDRILWRLAGTGGPGPVVLPTSIRWQP
jgi:hypothetical protein